ncbi:hypothetical protein D3227_04750 [Mesorhizobium waimense]|uniref:Uncharacterized protein n=1 Tax=Mesorhizobium waimense TaxID=1300307 RepID=A0A3A5L7A5_9HYPH|nr:hypothetical protein [Mesorhizobium waimense]RJT41991.1 hypothetical protein D3227_04750 [Mesorhizobium waimense]
MSTKEIPADVMVAATDVARRWYHEEWEPENYIQQKLIEGIARAILAERERIAKRIEATYRNEEGEALRATFIVPEAKDGYLQAWHQASDVADFVRYNPQ